MSPFTQSGRLVWRAQQSFLPASQVGSDLPKPGPRCWEAEEEESCSLGPREAEKTRPLLPAFCWVLLLLEEMATDPIMQFEGSGEEAGSVHSNTAPVHGDLREQKINVPPPLPCRVWSRAGPLDRSRPTQEALTVKRDASPKQGGFCRPAMLPTDK